MKTIQRLLIVSAVLWTAALSAHAGRYTAFRGVLSLSKDGNVYVLGNKGRPTQMIVANDVQVKLALRGVAAWTARDGRQPALEALVRGKRGTAGRNQPAILADHIQLAPVGGHFASSARVKIAGLLSPSKDGNDYVLRRGGNHPGIVAESVTVKAVLAGVRELTRINNAVPPLDVRVTGKRGEFDVPARPAIFAEDIFVSPR